MNPKPRRTVRRRSICVAITAVLAIVSGAVVSSPVTAQEGAASEAEVRIVARKLENGKIEFGLQERQTDGTWGRLMLPFVRFFPATATVGLWLRSAPVEPTVGEVRIVARKRENGKVEFGLQQRQGDNTWSDRLLPRERFLPTTARVGQWLGSTPLTLTAPQAAQELAGVRLTLGGDASGPEWPGCSSEHCRHLSISLQGAPAGAYDIECWSSRDGSAWYTGRWRWPSSGLWTEGGCWFGYPGEQVWVIVDGVRSNTITWPTGTPTTTTTTTSPTGSESTLRLSTIAAGHYHTCGLRTDGTIACWGNNQHHLAHGFIGVEFSAITASNHTCGLRTDGTIACGGYNDSGQADPPAGRFTAVTAGLLHTCGVRTDGTIACWGGNRSSDGSFAGQADPPAGQFSAVAAGTYHTCGLRTDGTVTCWGENNFGQADPPAGRFSAVSAGGIHTCGLRTDGSLSCWGGSWGVNVSSDGSIVGQANPPAGRYSAVTIGTLHACGLRTDGTVTCWGYDDAGQTDAPAGQFSAVAVGQSHTCGLRTGGTVTCWGENDLGQTEVPAGAEDSGTPTTDVSVPGRVGRPSVVAGDGQLRVSWSAPDDGGSPILVYEVFARERGSERWPIRETSATSPATVTGLTNGVAYDVFVRAVNAVGGGEPSPTVSGTPVGDVSVPGRVGRPSVVAGDGQLEVSWSAPDDGGSAITNYAVWYRPRGEAEWVRHSSGATSPHTIGGLTNGVTYDVAVRARNSAGWGRWSASASGLPTTDVSVPGRVGRPSVVAGDGQLEVSWSAPDDGGSAILEYEVFARERGRDGGWPIRERSATSPATVTGLTNGVAYDVFVRAVNEVGGGQGSPAVSATPRRITAPSKPVLTLSHEVVPWDSEQEQPGSRTLTLNWHVEDDGGAPIVGYTLWYRESLLQYQPLQSSDTPQEAPSTTQPVDLVDQCVLHGQFDARSRLGASPVSGEATIHWTLPTRTKRIKCLVRPSPLVSNYFKTLEFYVEVTNEDRGQPDTTSRSDPQQLEFLPWYKSPETPTVTHLKVNDSVFDFGAKNIDVTFLSVDDASYYIIQWRLDGEEPPKSEVRDPRNRSELVLLQSNAEWSTRRRVTIDNVWEGDRKLEIQVVAINDHGRTMSGWVTAPDEGARKAAELVSSHCNDIGPSDATTLDMSTLLGRSVMTAASWASWIAGGSIGGILRGLRAVSWGIRAESLWAKFDSCFDSGRSFFDFLKGKRDELVSSYTEMIAEVEAVFASGSRN